MGNKNESCRISLAAVNNCVGRVFAAGGAKVVRPERNGYTVLAIIACQQCGQEHRLTVVKLGDYLRYPNERLWQCAASACPSRNSAPAKPAPESDNLRLIAEKEFRERRQPAGVPVEQQREYARIFAGFVLTSPTIEATDSPHYFTRPAFLGMSPQNRAAWVKWAADVVTLEGEKRRQAAAKEALRYGYARLTQAHKHINKLDELVSFDEYAGYTDEERGHLASYSADILDA